jgi:pimeloyl-ACP methyl ester carboxylesterase
MSSEQSKHRRVEILLVVTLAPLLLWGAVRGAIRLGIILLERRYPPPGRMVSVGDHKLHLYCVGSGSPTVVIEAGGGVTWGDWGLVVPKLAESNRVCVYDRAGYGWSEPGPEPRTALQCANELHQLLLNAGVPEPYVLVAHSFGGYIARVYAGRFGDSLSGVVLVDTSHEDEPKPEPGRPVGAPSGPPRLSLGLVVNWLWPMRRRLVERYEGESALPPRDRSLPLIFQRRLVLACSPNAFEAARNELQSRPESEAQTRAALFPKNLPLTMVTAGHWVSPRPSTAPVPEVPAIHVELQSRLTRLSSCGKQIVARSSGHMIPLDQPELIIDVVREMLRNSGCEGLPGEGNTRAASKELKYTGQSTLSAVASMWYPSLGFEPRSGANTPIATRLSSS